MNKMFNPDGDEDQESWPPVLEIYEEMENGRLIHGGKSYKKVGWSNGSDGRSLRFARRSLLGKMEKEVSVDYLLFNRETGNFEIVQNPEIYRSKTKIPLADVYGYAQTNLESVELAKKSVIGLCQ